MHMIGLISSSDTTSNETRYGRFFTVSTEARFELLMRLLELNFQQAAEQTGRSLEAVMKEAQQHV